MADRLRLKGRIRSVTRRVSGFSFTDREWEQMETVEGADRVRYLEVALADAAMALCLAQVGLDEALGWARNAGDDHMVSVLALAVKRARGARWSAQTSLEPVVRELRG